MPQVTDRWGNTAPMGASLLADPQVVATIGGIQILDCYGDCHLRWVDGSNEDHLVSGVEADACKLDEDRLLDDLCRMGVPAETAASVVQVCW